MAEVGFEELDVAARVVLSASAGSGLRLAGQTIVAIAVEIIRIKAHEKLPIRAIGAIHQQPGATHAEVDIVALAGSATEHIVGRACTSTGGIGTR